MTKSNLKRTRVSDEHYSSGRSSKDAEPKCTHCAVTILNARNLLASDADTGKSDPVCFISISPASSTPHWDAPNLAELGILMTPVKAATVNPEWNYKLIFPLVVESAAELMHGCLHILVRDEDSNTDGSTSYDNLGQVTIPLQEVMAHGKKLTGRALKRDKQDYRLQKCPNMAKVDGHLTATVSLVFAEEDTSPLQEELGVFSVSALVDAVKHYALTGSRLGASSGSELTNGDMTGRSRITKRSGVAATPRISSPVRFTDDRLKSRRRETNSSDMFNTDNDGSGGDDDDDHNRPSTSEFSSRGGKKRSDDSKTAGVIGNISTVATVSDSAVLTDVESRNETEQQQQQNQQPLAANGEERHKGLDNKAQSAHSPARAPSQLLHATIQYLSITVRSLEVGSKLDEPNYVFVDIKHGKLWTTRTDIQPLRNLENCWEVGEKSPFRYDVTLEDLTRSEIEVTIMTATTHKSLDSMIMGRASGCLDKILSSTPGGYDGLSTCILRLPVFTTIADKTSETTALSSAEPAGSMAGSVEVVFRLVDVKWSAHSEPPPGEPVNLPLPVATGGDGGDDDGLFFDDNDQIAGGKPLLQAAAVPLSAVQPSADATATTVTPVLQTGTTPRASLPSRTSTSPEDMQISNPRPTADAVCVDPSEGEKGGASSNASNPCPPPLTHPTGGDEEGAPAEMEVAMARNKSSRINKSPAPAPSTASSNTSPDGFVCGDIQFLYVEVHDLPRVEGMMGGKNDLYVELLFGRKWKVTTDVIDESGTDGVWDTSKLTSFLLPQVTVQDLSSSLLSIVVMDKNIALIGDTIVGKALGDIHAVLSTSRGGYDGSEVVKLKVELSSSDHKYAGNAEVSFQVTNIKRSEHHLPPGDPSKTEPQSESKQELEMLPSVDHQPSTPPPAYSPPSSPPIPTNPPDNAPTMPSEHVNDSPASVSREPTQNSHDKPIAINPAEVATAPTAASTSGSDPPTSTGGTGPVCEVAAGPVLSASVAVPGTKTAAPDSREDTTSGLTQADVKTSVPQLDLRSKKTQQQKQQVQASSRQQGRSNQPVVSNVAATEPVNDGTESALNSGRGVPSDVKRRGESRQGHSAQRLTTGPSEDTVPSHTSGFANTDGLSKTSSNSIRGKHTQRPSGASKSRDNSDLKALKQESKKALRREQSLGGRDHSPAVSRTSSGFFVSVDGSDIRQQPRQPESNRHDMDTFSTADTVDVCSEIGDDDVYGYGEPDRSHSMGRGARVRYGQDHNSRGDGMTAQGSTTATVRALKELARHEKYVNTAVTAMYRDTEQKYSQLEGKIHQLERQTQAVSPPTQRPQNHSPPAQRQQRSPVHAAVGGSTANRTYPFYEDIPPSSGDNRRKGVYGDGRGLVPSTGHVDVHRLEHYPYPPNTYTNPYNPPSVAVSHTQHTSSRPQHTYAAQPQLRQERQYPLNNPYYHQQQRHQEYSDQYNDQDTGLYTGQYTDQFGTVRESNGMDDVRRSGEVLAYRSNQVGDLLDTASESEVARTVLENIPPESISGYSSSVRSRLFDFISNQMTRGQHIDKCLDYVSTLINYTPPYDSAIGGGGGGGGITAGEYGRVGLSGGASASVTGISRYGLLVRSLPGHTVRNIQEGLQHVSMEASDRGIYACRLEHDLSSLVGSSSS